MDTTLTPPLLPNPPIIDSPKEILMADAIPSYRDKATGKILTPYTQSEPRESINDKDPAPTKNEILLSEEDNHRLYVPWIHSAIIKIVKSKFNHQYLKRKLEDLWKLSEPLCLIDLGMGFFTVNLASSESQSTILHGGPWFIPGCFFSVRKWEPNFVSSESKEDSTPIWIRLPYLPTELYDASILQRIGRKIGQLLKVEHVPQQS
ncbi:hypothetical protein BC332_09970 [Capsicum chinense]|nr:hypothetical protein BC332_09970 [Capsicum chinense]